MLQTQNSPHWSLYKNINNIDMKQQTNCCCTTEPSRLINLILLQLPQPQLHDTRPSGLNFRLEEMCVPIAVLEVHLFLFFQFLCWHTDRPLWYLPRLSITIPHKVQHTNITKSASQQLPPPDTHLQVGPPPPELHFGPFIPICIRGGEGQASLIRGHPCLFIGFRDSPSFQHFWHTNK